MDNSSVYLRLDDINKESWAEVKRELIEDKGLGVEIVDKLGVFVTYKGNPLDMM